MKTDLSPFFRDSLGSEAVHKLQAGPEGFRIKGEKGPDGYSATLLRLNATGLVIGVLANERGHATAAAAVEAVLARVRELAA